MVGDEREDLENAARIDEVGSEDWRAFANETGYGARYVLDAVRARAHALGAGRAPARD